jgi:hypothetical protein
MKKIVLLSLATCLSLIMFSAQSMAAISNTSSAIPVSTPVESVEAEVLLQRLHEINVMDKSTLNRTEKRSLRIEVRSIKQQLRVLGGGLYISVGAIIIIVLLLIILF